MMKTSILRQARVCRVALQAATRAQIASRPALSAHSALAATPRALAASARPLGGTLLRFYSSEAAVQDHGAGPAPVTKFADLASLGVNGALVRAVTQGMGYEKMTDVQSATINAGLDGKDLYVARPDPSGYDVWQLANTVPGSRRRKPEPERRWRS